MAIKSTNQNSRDEPPYVFVCHYLSSSATDRISSPISNISLFLYPKLCPSWTFILCFCYLWVSSRYNSFPLDFIQWCFTLCLYVKFSSLMSGCVCVVEILEYPGKWNQSWNILECPGIWFHVLEYPGKFSPFGNKRKDWTLSQYLRVMDLTFATVS